MIPRIFLFCFFFNDTATTEIYTLSLHDALPISHPVKAIADSVTKGSPKAEESKAVNVVRKGLETVSAGILNPISEDRKSTRLNSSHANISYAVFCLKKKKKI